MSNDMCPKCRLLTVEKSDLLSLHSVPVNQRVVCKCRTQTSYTAVMLQIDKIQQDYRTGKLSSSQALAQIERAILANQRAEWEREHS